MRIEERWNRAVSLCLTKSQCQGETGIHLRTYLPYNQTAKGELRKSSGIGPPLKGLPIFLLTVSLKRYPDTNPEVFCRLFRGEN